MTATADSRGRFTLAPSCTGAGTCRAQVALAHSGRALPRRTISLASGKRLRLRFATTGATRRSFARGSRLRFKVTLAARMGTSLPYTTKVLVVKGKAAKARKPRTARRR